MKRRTARVWRIRSGTVELRDAHPNTALLELNGQKRQKADASGVVHRAAGAIVVNKIDGSGT